MKIAIDKLTEAELIDLNHRVVERLRFLHQMRAHAQMLEFNMDLSRSPGVEDERGNGSHH